MPRGSMPKYIRLSYSSPLNITFEGEDEWEAPDNWDDYTPEEQRSYLDEEEQQWLNENVEVYTEVVDESIYGDDYE